MNNIIVNAIHNQQVLCIEYNGGERFVEPHCYGQGKNGHDLLRAYQVSGHSNSGQTEGWKLFRVEEANSISEAGKSFPGPRDRYNPDGDKAIPHVYAML